MPNIRIAILSTYDEICAFLDNTVKNAMHYWDDELHTYLKGSAYTYTFKTFTDHEDGQYLAVGNKISFVYKNKGYCLNIVNVERDDIYTTVIAYGLSLELTNEETGAYSSSGAMSFEQYVTAFNFEKTFVIGVNEVSDKRITHSWDGTDTILARLFSLANVFSAELEFITELNRDYSLKRIVMNIYREHDDSHQGIGSDKTTEGAVRYGNGIKGISKTSDITELYTAIRPIGTDGLTLASINKNEYDIDGNLEYTSPQGTSEILAPLARDRFPSTLMADVNGRYICKVWSYETDNVNMLYGQALAQLKKNCTPQVSYTVDGYIDGEIGDTFVIEDSEYKPTLYLEARITEQQISFTNRDNCKTTFDNFEELESQVNSELLNEMKNMINANKTYDANIISSNGIVFKNDDDQTVLTAVISDKGVNVTDDFFIAWKKDGKNIKTGASITVSSSDFEGTAVYLFEASINDIVKAQYEVTCLNVRDGVSTYLHKAYANSDDGLLDFSLTESNRRFLGLYSDNIIETSTDPSKYQWSAIKGEDAQVLESMTEQFYYSDSSIELVNGEWFEGNIEYNPSKYLWKRWKGIYSNPSETKYTKPIYDNTWNAIDSKIGDIHEEVTEATSKIVDAVKEAEQASKDATDAVTKAEQASKDATDAKNSAEESNKSLANANEEIKKINSAVDDAKKDIQNAVDEINTSVNEITAIKRDYATKIDLSDANRVLKADISAEITEKVGEVETTISESYLSKNDAAELEGRLQTKITQNQNEIVSQASKIEKLEADTTQAQKDISDAIEKASTAQSSANAAVDAASKARDIANDAQSTVDAANENLAMAQTDLENAKKNLETVTGRVDASEKEITDAKARVTEAEKNVAQAQNDASNAQNAANNAIASANEAQQKADDAKANAEAAQKELDGLKSRVTSAETTIKQNSDAITSTATKITELGDNITSVQSTAEQTAEKFNWLVKSGTDETNFMLTDRIATLISQYINLNGLVSFSGLGADAQSCIEAASTNASNAIEKATEVYDDVSGWRAEEDKTLINGGKIYTGSVTTEQIATDAIKSKNYVADETGAFLSLADGTFDSKNLKWNTLGEINATAGTIGGWTIDNTSISTSDAGMSKEIMMSLHPKNGMISRLIERAAGMMYQTLISSGMIAIDYKQTEDTDEDHSSLERGINLSGGLINFHTKTSESVGTIEADVNTSGLRIQSSALSITGQGRSSSWVAGRDNALVKMSTISGYSPFASIKTTNGSWEIGTYDVSSFADYLVFSYIQDSDYKKNNNTPTKQITFGKNGVIGGTATAAKQATNAYTLNGPYIKAWKDGDYIGFYDSSGERRAWIGRNGTNNFYINNNEGNKLIYCSSKLYANLNDSSRIEGKVIARTLSDGNGTYYTILTNNGSKEYVHVCLINGGAVGIDCWRSDARLKTNIEHSEVDALSIIDSIVHRSFNWREDGSFTENGYIAQELEQINEDFVIKLPQSRNIDGKQYFTGDYRYQVSSSSIIPYLSKGIQELHAKVKDQQNEIDELKSMVLAQQEQINELRALIK